MRARVDLIGAVVVLAASCCGGGSSANRGGGTNEPLKPAGDAHAGDSRSQRDMVADTQLIKDAVLQLEDYYADGDIVVELMADAGVPGVTVFSVDIDMDDDETEYVMGVVANDRVVFDRAEARVIVARAWGYGLKRTVPPGQVARVMGLLLSSGPPAFVYASAEEIARLPDSIRAHVAPPSETTVDGDPAVEFYGGSDDEPYWRVRVVFRPDGAVDVVE